MRARSVAIVMVAALGVILSGCFGKTTPRPDLRPQDAGHDLMVSDTSVTPDAGADVVMQDAAHDMAAPTMCPVLEAFAQSASGNPLTVGGVTIETVQSETSSVSDGYLGTWTFDTGAMLTFADPQDEVIFDLWQPTSVASATVVDIYVDGQLVQDDYEVQSEPTQVQIAASGFTTIELRFVSGSSSHVAIDNLSYGVPGSCKVEDFDAGDSGNPLTVGDLTIETVQGEESSVSGGYLGTWTFDTGATITFTSAQTKVRFLLWQPTPVASPTLLNITAGGQLVHADYVVQASPTEVEVESATPFTAIGLQFLSGSSSHVAIDRVVYE